MLRGWLGGLSLGLESLLLSKVLGSILLVNNYWGLEERRRLKEES